MTEFKAKKKGYVGLAHKKVIQPKDKCFSNYKKLLLFATQ